MATFKHLSDSFNNSINLILAFIDYVFIQFQISTFDMTGEFYLILFCALWETIFY